MINKSWHSQNQRDYFRNCLSNVAFRTTGEIVKIRLGIILDATIHSAFSLSCFSSRHRVELLINDRHPNERTVLRGLPTNHYRTNEITTAPSTSYHVFLVLIFVLYIFCTYSLCTGERWSVFHEWPHSGSMISWNKKNEELRFNSRSSCCSR